MATKKMFDISLLGDKDLQRTLNRLPTVVQGKAMRRALRTGAKVVQEDAKRRAPVDQGDLRRGIKVRSGRRSRIGPSMLVSFPDRTKLRSGGYYPIAIEYGTRHQRAQPMLRAAIREKRLKVLATIRATLAAEIRKFRSAR